MHKPGLFAGRLLSGGAAGAFSRRPLFRYLLSLALCSVLFAAFGTPTPAAAGPPDRDLPYWVDAPKSVYFEETGHNLSEPFLFYWRMNGDRAIFGLPISEPITQGDGTVIQYFERMALQYRPNSGGATALVIGYGAITNTSVNLRIGPGTTWGKVGVLRSQQAVRLVGGPLPDADGAPWYEIAGVFGTGWTMGEFLERHDDPISVATMAVDLDNPRTSERAFAPLPPVVVAALSPDGDDHTFFPTSGHSLAGAFLTFWQANGGTSTFGLPISEPFDELGSDGQVRQTQYFEHARMEFHTDLAGTDAQVQLGLLGAQSAQVARVNTRPAVQGADSPIYSPDLFEGIKWIEVNISEQRLTAWEGDLPILTTLIRSGKPGWDTPRGTFHTFRKVLSDDMTLFAPGDPDYYYTPNVPWVMYFLDGGFAVHGAVWDDMWGTPTSHGCVNVPVDLAEYLYNWAPLGTIVWIHD
jgi:L,D-transpeptidase catalytic domain